MQQMGPMGFIPSPGLHPDQVLTLLAPLVLEAERVVNTSAASVRSALQESVLAAYLVGRGMPPASAWDLVQRWRMAGVSQFLVRTPRTGETGTTPGGAPESRTGQPTGERLRNGGPAPGRAQDGATTPDTPRNGATAPGTPRNGATAPDRAQDGATAPDRAQDGATTPDRAQDGATAPDRAQDGATAPDGAQDGATTPDRAQDGARDAQPVRPGVPGTPGEQPAPAEGQREWVRYLSPQEREELIRRVADYAQDEVTAAAFYGELLQRAPDDETIRAYIRHAMEDEQQHARSLSDLYRDLTGRTIQIAPGQVTYEDLRSGLVLAMNDEYDAFESYRQTYLDFPYDQVRNLFLELMTDELEHATRFNYVLQSLGT